TRATGIRSLVEGVLELLAGLLGVGLGLIGFAFGLLGLVAADPPGGLLGLALGLLGHISCLVTHVVHSQLLFSRFERCRALGYPLSGGENTSRPPRPARSGGIHRQQAGKELGWATSGTSEGVKTDGAAHLALDPGRTCSRTR